MSVSLFGSLLANDAVCSPALYCQTMEPVWLTSMTLLLFWSAMRMSPFGSCSALLGLLRVSAPEGDPYDQTTCFVEFTSITRSLPWSVIRMFPFGSWTAKTGTLSWSGPEPLTPACPYCQTMPPVWLTMITRLSTHAATGAKPAGLPVPAIRVSPPARRSASLGPIIDPGPGLHSDPFPEPKLHTTLLVSGSTSITRLLNWSVINRLPGVLKGPPDRPDVDAAVDEAVEELTTALMEEALVDTLVEVLEVLFEPVSRL
jgi:hypothetical protein